MMIVVSEYYQKNTPKALLDTINKIALFDNQMKLAPYFWTRKKRESMFKDWINKKNKLLLKWEE